ncbi:MAG: UvrD-helicase domain-containing protein [Lentisphaeria bacterium]
MKEFSAYQCLLNGINLIEAGAGTGKTYNIQTLVARIVLEKAVPITRILVVTYTRAATAELQERLRKVLDCLLRRLNQVDIPPGEQERTDAILAKLRALPESEPFWQLPVEGPKNLSREEKFQRNATLLLQNALRDFDQAAISTIHSFCQRMLTENAFESGIRYGMKLVNDTTEVTDALIQQFIRREFYTCTPEETAAWESLDIVWQRAEYEKNDDAPNFFQGKATFMEQLQSAMRDNDVDYYWGKAEKEGELFIPPERQLILTEIAACRQEIARNKTAVEKVFATLLQHLKLGSRAGWEANQEALLTGQGGVPLAFLQNLTFAGLREQTYKRKQGDTLPIDDQKLKTILENPVFEIFGRLTRLLQDYRSRVFYEAMEFVKTELAKQKSHDGFMTFNDLLNELEKRLRDPERGILLQQLIRKQFPFALVDEFQDTDGVQFTIFHTIFAAAGAQETGGFFLIGDPKQSIYRFRGGDVFTYLRARNQVPEERRFTLTTNYRSSQAFIAEINRFYRFNQPHPFAHPELQIPEVAWPEKTQPALLYKGREYDKPLVFTKSKGAQELLYQSIAQEIGGMLRSGKWAIGNGNEEPSPLKFSDFAVLFRNNSHAMSMEKVLRRTGIPVVRIGTSNVLASESAKTMRVFLQAVLDPSDSQKIVQLLASPLHRLGANEIYELRNTQNSGLLLHFQSWLSDLAEKWKSKSFLPMVMEYLGAKNMPIMLHLLAGDDGERALMDFLHLAEIISNAESERKLSREALATHFQRLCQNLPNDDDENLIRLANARDAVILATVHYSKGLEYPLVFLPDIHDKKSRQELVCHYERKGIAKMLKDITSLGFEQEKCALEAMQERLRLYYVAITRAKFFCKVFVDTGGASIFNYLFRDRSRQQAQESLEKLVSSLPKNPSPQGALEFGLNYQEPESAESAEEILATNSLGERMKECDLPEMELQVLPHPEKIDPYWYTLSATALMQRLQVQAEAAEADRITTEQFLPVAKDLDEADAGNEELGKTTSDTKLTPEEWADLPPIFTFSPGKQTGTCWHAIFEILDFAADEDEIRRICNEKLSLYSLPATTEDVATVAGMVSKVLRADLVPLQGYGAAFQLRECKKKERLNELEFTYGLAEQKKLRLKEEFLRRNGLPNQQVFESSLGRAMTGSIDLLLRKEQRYYIIDWKSNVINYQLENFSGAGLQQEMQRHGYPLQYLVYTAALVEFLRQRLGYFGAAEYEQQIGGVFYLFLRGVDPESPGRGIVSCRPTFPDIETLLSMIGTK